MTHPPILLPLCHLCFQSWSKVITSDRQNKLARSSWSSNDPHLHGRQGDHNIHENSHETFKCRILISVLSRRLLTTKESCLILTPSLMADGLSMFCVTSRMSSQLRSKTIHFNIVTNPKTIISDWASDLSGIPIYANSISKRSRRRISACGGQSGRKEGQIF